MIRTKNISVIGASSADDRLAGLAREVGRLIAVEKWTLICGGLGGVMEQAARGASEAGGLTVGILPGYDHDAGNKWLSVVIPTGLGHARNTVVAAAADGIVAVGGQYGTLSEMAVAVKLEKPVASLESWGDIGGVKTVSSPGEAISWLKDRIA